MKNFSITLFTFFMGLIFSSCMKDNIAEYQPDDDYLENASMAGGVSTTIAVPFNQLFTRYGNGWTGGDATYSILLPGGKTLWLFGDSFLDTVYADRSRPASGLVRNVFVVQKAKNFTTLVGGTIDEPEAFVNTPDPDNAWYWPLDGTVIGDRLYVFMAYFIRTGSGGFDFEFIRTDLVEFSLPGITEISRTTVWEGEDILFGASVLEVDDYIYIYGSEKFSFTKYCQVARVPADDIYADWEYFDGEEWVEDFPADAGRLKKGNGLPVDVSSQFSVFFHEGKYRLLTQEGFLGPKIHSYESTALTGPWKFKTIVYTTPEPASEVWTYNAWIHSQFIHPVTGAILMSYNTNAINFFDLFSNADYYRPYFVWVDYL